MLVNCLDNEVRIRMASAMLVLSPFEAWEPALELMGAMEDFFSTGAGLTQKEYQRAVGWSEKLSRLDARLVSFYAKNAPENTTASVSLWRMLKGGAPLDGWQYSILRGLWEDQYGVPPSIELCPRL